MTLRRLALAVTIAVVCLESGDALADEKSAGEFFRAGAAAYSKGDYRAAALAFEKAFKDAPRGAAIYNAAMAWESAGDHPRAADAFALALARSDLDSAQVDMAKKRLAEEQRALGRLEITGPVTYSVAHVEQGSAPGVVHVKPGPHAVAVRRADGSTETRSVVATAGTVTAVAFATQPAPEVAPEPTKTPARLRDARDRTGDPAAQRKVGIIIAGTSLVAVAAAAVTGGIALAAKSDFDDSGFRDADAHDRADTFRTVANVSWVAAAALLVTGATIYLAAPKPKPNAARRFDFVYRF